MTPTETTRVVTLHPLGDVSLELPRRFSSRAMLLASYGQEQDAGDRGRVGLVIAAAWGLCWTGECSDGTARPVPKFRPETDRITAYGAVVLDYLLGRYGVAVNGPVWKTGGEVMDWVMQSVPLQPEVDAEVNFTSPPGAESTAALPSGKTSPPDSPARP